jgi:ribose-phosphate pyrophosphokinase
MRRRCSWATCRKQNYDDLSSYLPTRRWRRPGRAIAKRLDSELAIIDKRRRARAWPRAVNIIGDVNAATMRHHGRHRRHGEHAVQGGDRAQGSMARRVVAYCTHAVLSGGAVQRIATSSRRDRRRRHDSAHRGSWLLSHIRVLSCAQLLAETSDPRVERGVGGSLFME